MIDVKIFKQLKVRFRSQTEDELVLNDSFDNDIFYRELPYLNFSQNPIIIDVGAHIGTFSMYSAIKFPSAKIYSFEASNDTFSLLQKNITENRLSDKIKIFHQALCGNDGSVKLYHNVIDGNWGHTISKNVSSSFEIVEGISMSTFVSSNKINDIDLIKFNCEGAEFDIILNCPEAILAKIKCAIILYHSDLVSEKYSVKQIEARLVNSNHKCFFINQSENRGWIISINKRHYSTFIFLWISRLKRKLRLWRASI